MHGIKIDFFKVVSVLVIVILAIYFIIQIEDRNIENEPYGFYVPEDVFAPDKAVKKPEDTLTPIQTNNLKTIYEKGLYEVEILIRLQKYKKVLSKINSYLKEESGISVEDKDVMRFYQMILLYNQGYKTRARKIYESLKKKRLSRSLSLKVGFFSKFIKK